MDIIIGPSQSGRTAFALGMIKNKTSSIFVSADVEPLTDCTAERVVLQRGNERRAFEVLSALVTTRKAQCIVIDDAMQLVKSREVVTIANLALGWNVPLVIVGQSSDMSSRVCELRLPAHIPGTDYLAVPVPARSTDLERDRSDIMA
ncbi:MAG: hypothetical protein K2X45_02040 [Phreatobacter sp.]|nr:hypothetical protein [Phreatobacter sp.]